MRQAQSAFNRPFFMQLLAPEWLGGVPSLDAILRKPTKVADVGCGCGWSAIGLAKTYPGIEVDGFDLDGPSIEAANSNARTEGVADRVRFHHRDAGDLDIEREYDLVAVFECIHDLPDPVAVLTTMRRLAADDGVVIVMDEKAAASFGAIGDDVERLMHGFSNMICLPDGLSHPGSVGTGTVMRRDTLAGYAEQAGFERTEDLPVDADLWQFYQLS